MTDDTSPSPDSLHRELAEIRHVFEGLLRTIDSEGAGRVREPVASLLERLEKLTKDLRSTYVQQILERRFQPVADDRRRLPEVRNPDELVSLVIRVDGHIRTVEREMDMLVPRKSPLALWLSDHRRLLVKAGLGLALAVLLVTGVRSFTSRNKGLIGEYFKGNNFEQLVNRRRDLTLDFFYRNRRPIRGLTPNNFSVRWTGYVRIPEDGIYEFVTRADDGVRVWLGEDRVIDGWKVQRETTDRGARELKAGLVPIRVEWFQRGGPATLRLLWRRQNEAQPTLIPPENLSPTRG